MENPEQYYKIPRGLDQESLMMGYAKIEIIPALVIAGLGFFVGMRLVALGASITLFIVIRYLRRKYGKNVFSRFSYSYLNGNVIKLFKRLPSSAIKYWRF